MTARRRLVLGAHANLPLEARGAPRVRPTSREAALELLVETCSFSSVGRERSSEHGPLAYRLFFRRFILNDVPMLDKHSVLNAHNICGDPIHRSTETAKSPVHDHKLSLSHDRSRLVLQRWWNALDEIEQTFTTRCDMSAVLNIVRRPVALSRRVIALVEEGIERLKENRLIFRFTCLFHFLHSSRHLIYATS